ncbi:MAG: helix-hairpin-helix domain-containing protein, partial [Thermomicrobiales bacterium]
IKTVVGANDFASMKEIVGRRFRRAAEMDEEEQGKWTTLPDLVIIDGGKGQLGAALEALEETGMSVPICGLAKENEELFLPGRPDPVILPRDSQALFLVQRVRDEAHRFAITFHRAKRSKAAFKSGLDDVPGVGPVRKKALIRHFGSVKAIREATVEDLLGVEGVTRQVAEQIKATLGSA